MFSSFVSVVFVFAMPIILLYNLLKWDYLDEKYGVKAVEFRTWFLTLSLAALIFPVILNIVFGYFLYNILGCSLCSRLSFDGLVFFYETVGLIPFVLSLVFLTVSFLINYLNAKNNGTLKLSRINFLLFCFMLIVIILPLSYFISVF